MSRYPLYNLAQFVDQIALNNGTNQIISAVRDIASGLVFFSPGVANPGNLTFGFNSNLIVTVKAVPPFHCLFVSGAYTDAHGITNGVDNSGIYSVDFTSLVPVSGPPVTAYIVASLASVDESIIPITGPPSGHPDFNANFDPYNGYTVLQDSLNISVTLTPPDNETFIELARTGLSVGQTIITTVDTSHQVLAHVITPPTIVSAAPIAIGSNVGINSSGFTSVYNLSLTMPIMGEAGLLWRVLTELITITQFTSSYNGVTNAAVESYLADDAPTDIVQWANIRGNSILLNNGNTDVVTTSGFGVSYPYQPGATVTLTVRSKFYSSTPSNITATMLAGTQIRYYIVSALE